MNNKGQFELEGIHPLAVIAGAIGAFVGFYSVSVMGGGGVAVGEAAYHVGIIWKILIPVACAIGCFFIAQRIFSS
jgi:hypothetical protein